MLGFTGVQPNLQIRVFSLSEQYWGLSELKQTKVYQEAYEEGEQIGERKGEQKAKLEAIPRMLRFGLSLEVIAQLLDLSLEVVQQAAQPSDGE